MVRERQNDLSCAPVEPDDFYESPDEEFQEHFPSSHSQFDDVWRERQLRELFERAPENFDSPIFVSTRWPNGDVRYDPVHPAARFAQRLPWLGYRAGIADETQWHLGACWNEFPDIAKDILIVLFEQKSSWTKFAVQQVAAPRLAATPPRSLHQTTRFAQLCFGDITPTLLPLSGFHGRRDLRDSFS